ncbi:MAG: DMT family transporter [Gammaproteobacteria bacterium]|nr:DMT family transporter [Gammaproteobacteria bacterium]
MMAIVFALGSSLGWGVSDYMGGLKSRSLPMLTVLLVSQGTALAVLAAVLAAEGGMPPDNGFLLAAAVAGTGEMIGIAALYRGLARGTMSIVAPISNAAPVVPLSAAAVLGEVPGTMQLGGVVLVLSGILLTSIERSKCAPGRRASVMYGLLSALGFGTFFTAMNFASEGAVPWALFLARLTSVTVLSLAALLFVLFKRSCLAVSRSRLPALAAIGLLIVAADAMFAFASTLGLLSIVAVLAGLHPVVTVALARLHLRERIGSTRYAGIAICLLGVLAITGRAG